MIKFFFITDSTGIQISPAYQTRLEAEAGVMELRAEGYCGLRIQEDEEPVDTDGDTSRWNENGEGGEADNDRYASRNYRD